MSDQNRDKPDREQLMREALAHVREIANDCREAGHTHGPACEDAIQVAASDLVNSFEAIEWFNENPHRASMRAHAERLAEDRLSFSLHYGFIGIADGYGTNPGNYEALRAIFRAVALVELIFEARVADGWVPTP